MFERLCSVWWLGIFAIVGCEYDFHRGISIQEDHVVPFQARAEQFTREAAEVYGGEELSHVVVKVYWTDTLCPGYDKTAVIYNGECYAGLNFGCSDIYVADRGDIYNSAFTHELGHCYRDILYGDPDAAHLDTDWWLFVEYQPNVKLKELIDEQ